MLDVAPADSSESSSPAVELAKPSVDADIALMGIIDPVFKSFQCGCQPGGNLHSDGIIICAWVVVMGARKNVVKKKNGASKNKNDRCPL